MNSLVTGLQETPCSLLAQLMGLFILLFRHCCSVILQITNFKGTISKQNEVSTFFQLINQHA